MRLSELTSQQRYVTPENLLGRLALVTFESGLTHKDRAEIAATRFPNEEAVKMLSKSATDPARSNAPGYAQELTRTTYGELVDLLRGAAILPQCVPAAKQHAFPDGSSGIYVPMRLQAPTAAGVFRSEGTAISVRGLMFSHVLLTPKNMGVILTATEEMMHRSSIDLASYFQSAIAEDTAYALDALFVSNTAGSAIAPAGSRNGLTAADSRASTGATAAAINADVKTMITALTSANMGSPSTRWLMHPKNLAAVSMLLTATGARQFPEAEQARLAGYPVVQSTTMDPAIILLIDFAQYTFAMGTPEFEATSMATIHEEDTAPLAIGTPGSPATVAAPARSLWQSYATALRLVLNVDWLKLRAVGVVQELHSVAW